MNILNVTWHLGLGDAILCNGLIRWIAPGFDQVHIPCWKKNYETVRAMFFDRKDVEIILITEESEMFGRGIPGAVIDFRLGHYNTDVRSLPGETFDRWFYRQAGVDFEKRWSAFHIEGLDSSPKSNGLCFIHDDASRGFRIRTEELSEDRIQFQSPVPLARLCDAVQHASEIHCINSSILHLAESIPTAGKLYFHDYARHESDFDMPVLKKDWTIIR